MNKIKQGVDTALGFVCVALFVLMTVVGTYQIVTRYVFNAPSTVSEELLTFSFTWMALLAAAYVFGKRGHMRMSYFADKIHGKGAYWLQILSEVLVLIFSVVILIFGGISITKLTMTQVTASLGVPMGYIYAVLPVTGVLSAFYSIYNLKEIIGEGVKEQ